MMMLSCLLSYILLSLPNSGTGQTLDDSTDQGFEIFENTIFAFHLIGRFLVPALLNKIFIPPKDCDLEAALIEK